MTDVIDDATIEVDGGYGDDGRTVKAFLRLDGDFTRTFQEYLADPNQSFIMLELPRSVADDVAKSLREVLG